MNIWALYPPRPTLARIETATGVCDLVGRPVRRGKRRVAVSDRGELAGKIGDPARDQMHDFPLALDAPVTAIKLAAMPVRRNCSNIFRQTTRLAIPLSSSSVMKMTPLALPGC
jgi:hypothetical protein